MPVPLAASHFIIKDHNKGLPKAPQVSQPLTLTLVGAFEKYNNQKYYFLGNHMTWKKEKFKKLDQQELDQFEQKKK